MTILLTIWIQETVQKTREGGKKDDPDNSNSSKLDLCGDSDSLSSNESDQDPDYVEGRLFIIINKWIDWDHNHKYLNTPRTPNIVSVDELTNKDQTGSNDYLVL